jgi:hypothetical protein
MVTTQSRDLLDGTNNGNEGDPQYGRTRALDLIVLSFLFFFFFVFPNNSVFGWRQAKPVKCFLRKDESQGAQAQAITIDFGGIEDRTVRLTLGSSRIVSAALSNDGEQLVYLSKSDKGFEVWLLKPRAKELKRLNEIEATPKEFGALKQQLLLDKDAQTAFVLVEGHFSKVDLAGAKSESVKFDAKKELDGAAERKYLFEHVWRQMKEKFYVADMHGVDWDYYKFVYARFLPFITSAGLNSVAN